jgi:predicted outer membrane protein
MLKYACLPAALALVITTAIQADNPNRIQRQNDRQVRQNQRQQNQGQPAESRNQNTNSQGVVVGERNSPDVSQSQWSLESHLANCIMLQNQEEIELAQFAQQQTQNQKVKEFAQQMIQDHQQFQQKLQQFAGTHSGDMQQARQEQTQWQQGQRTPQQQNQTAQNARTNDVRDLNGDGIVDAREAASRQLQGQQSQGQAVQGQQNFAQNQQNQQNQTPDGRIEYRAGYGSAASLDDQLLQIERNAANKCQQMVREELQKHDGADFDKAFVGMQIGAHIGMIAQLQAAEQAVSGQFQQVLKEGEQASLKHKQHAEQLKKELMQDQSNTSNQ